LATGLLSDVQGEACAARPARLDRRPEGATPMRRPVLLALAVSVCLAGLGSAGCPGPGFEPCSLDPCAAEAEPNTSTICNLQPACSSYVCVSYLVDGTPSRERPPFCSAYCDPGGDGCGAGAACILVALVTGPADQANCVVDGHRAACLCVPEPFLAAAAE
jgi:hypothetical protein